MERSEGEMDTQQAIKTAKRTFRENLVSIGLANKVAKKLSPHLPGGWRCEIDWPGRLEISKWTRANAIEFRVVCDLVEKIINKKLSREAAGENYLKGSILLNPNIHRWLSITVYMGQVEGCKIIKKEEVRTYYEADPNCLGVSNVLPR